MASLPKRFKLSEIEEEPKLRKFKLSEIEEKSYDQSALDAAARGFGQAMFGLGDEAVGAAQAASDILSGEASLKDIVDKYKKYRDIERDKVKAAYEQQPGAAYGAEIASSFIPFLGMAGKLGKASKLAGLGRSAIAQGAASGYGMSEAKDIKGDIKSAAAGAALGKVADVALRKGGRLLKDKVLPVIEKPTYKAGEIMFDVPAKSVEKYVRRVGKYDKDLTPEKLGVEFLQEDIPTLEKIIRSDAKTAKKALSEAGELDRKEIADIIKKRADDLERSFEGIYDIDSEVAALKAMRELESKYSSAELANVVNPLRLKKTIQSLDKKIDYPVGEGRYVSPDNAVMMDLRRDLDELLKKNKAYEEPMKLVDENMRLLGEAKKLARTPGGFKNIFRRLGNAEEGQEIIPKDVIERVGKKIDKDLVDKAEFASARHALDRDLTRGSKNVQKFTHLLEQLPMGLGKILGPVIGSTVDHFGGKAARSAIDKIAELRGYKVKDPVKYGRIMESIRRGVRNKVPEALATRELLRQLEEYED